MPMVVVVTRNGKEIINSTYDYPPTDDVEEMVEKTKVWLKSEGYQQAGPCEIVVLLK